MSKIDKLKKLKKQGEILEVVQAKTEQAISQGLSGVELRKEQVLSLIAEGNREGQAATIVGLNIDTISRWKREDSKFAIEVEQAKLAWRSRLVRTVIIAAETDWKAAKFLLENQLRDEFGQQKKLEIEQIEKPKSIVIDMIDQIRGTEIETQKETASPATSKPLDHQDE